MAAGLHAQRSDNSGNLFRLARKNSGMAATIWIVSPHPVWRVLYSPRVRARAIAVRRSVPGVRCVCPAVGNRPLYMRVHHETALLERMVSDRTTKKTAWPDGYGAGANSGTYPYQHSGGNSSHVFECTRQCAISSSRCCHSALLAPSGSTTVKELSLLRRNPTGVPPVSATSSGAKGTQENSPNGKEGPAVKWDCERSQALTSVRKMVIANRFRKTVYQELLFVEVWYKTEPFSGIPTEAGFSWVQFWHESQNLQRTRWNPQPQI